MRLPTALHAVLATRPLEIGRGWSSLAFTFLAYGEGKRAMVSRLMWPLRASGCARWHLNGCPDGREAVAGPCSTMKAGQGRWRGRNPHTALGSIGGGRNEQRVQDDISLARAWLDRSMQGYLNGHRSEGARGRGGEREREREREKRKGRKKGQKGRMGHWLHMMIATMMMIMMMIMMMTMIMIMIVVVMMMMMMGIMRGILKGITVLMKSLWEAWGPMDEGSSWQLAVGRHQAAGRRHYGSGEVPPLGDWERWTKSKALWFGSRSTSPLKTLKTLMEGSGRDRARSRLIGDEEQSDGIGLRRLAPRLAVARWLPVVPFRAIRVAWGSHAIHEKYGMVHTYLSTRTRRAVLSQSC